MTVLTACSMPVTTASAIGESPNPTLTPSPIPTATETPVPTPTIVPSPTRVPPTPTPVTADARNTALHRIQQITPLLTADYAKHRDEIVAAVQDATRTYLDGVNDVAALKGSAGARDDLANVLTFNWPDGKRITRPKIDAVEIDKTVTVLLVAHDVQSLPMQLFVRQGGKLQATVLQPPLLGRHNPDVAFRGMLLEKVADVNGDGRQEIIIHTDWLSADSAPYTIDVLRWDPTGQKGQGGFVSLFTADIINWTAGPSGWSLVPHGEGQDIVTKCAAWGAFDFHLLIHPGLTRTYTWQSTGFSLAGVALDSPVSQRDAFDRGEFSFRRGDYAAAILRYRQVIDTKSLKADPGAKTNWIALAWFRIGESQALLHDLPSASASLGKAVDAGGSIGALAKTFRDSMGQYDGLTRAFAAIQASDIATQLAQGKAPDLGIEVDATGLLWPGPGVAAYLEAHPGVETASDAWVKSNLQSLGMRVTDLISDDYEGNFGNDYVALLPVGTATTAWVMSGRGGHWRALAATWPPENPVKLGESKHNADAPGFSVGLGQLFPNKAQEYTLSMADGQPVISTGPTHAAVPRQFPGVSGDCTIAQGLLEGPKS
jgi:hypothetical protein